MGIDVIKSVEEAWEAARSKRPSLLDEYEHVGLIGDGSFSVVKHYRHRVTRADYAVKELKPAFLSNDNYVHWFGREIKLLEALMGHDHVIELVSHGREGGRYFYITPKAETNLYDYVKRFNSTLGLRERVALFDQVLGAVKFAHSVGILHRDIAPTNVLLFKAGDDYTVKVSDFGLGKDLQSMSNYTRSEVSHYGHIYYVAPEQREKLKNASVRSDVYSLGKLLNFVLTGRDPDVLHPCEFTPVIERATRYDLEERHRDVVEFEREYEEIKSLLFSEEAVNNPRTLAEYTEGTREVNWREFHRLAVAGEYSDHVYADFVAPAVALLSDGDNLNKYYAAVGNSIGEFVTTFVERIDALAGVLGWSFSETKSFGALLRNIYELVTDSRVKLQCLKAIWNLAYEQDQWAVQDIMNRIMDGASIPDEIQTPFAAYVLRSGAPVTLESFSGLKLPRVIRQALIRKSNQAKGSKTME